MGVDLQPHTLAGREPAVLVKLATVGLEDVVVPLAQMCHDAVLGVVEATLCMSGICMLVAQHAALDGLYNREPVLVLLLSAVFQLCCATARCAVHMVLFVENHLARMLPGEAGVATSYADCRRDTGSSCHCDEREVDIQERVPNCVPKVMPVCGRGAVAGSLYSCYSGRGPDNVFL